VQSSLVAALVKVPTGRDAGVGGTCCPLREHTEGGGLWSRNIRWSVCSAASPVSLYMARALWLLITSGPTAYAHPSGSIDGNISEKEKAPDFQV